jgi:hypothetical protein
MFKINESWNGLTVGALDVSTQSTGWAMLKAGQLYNGAIQTPSKYVYERIRKLNIALKQISDSFIPDLIIMEAGFADSESVSFCPRCNEKIHGSLSFSDRSAEITMMLAEARGAASAAFGCPIMKIGNTTWKNKLGIFTRDKLQRDEIKYNVYIEACAMWNVDLPITLLGKKATYDESDAAAILGVVLRDMEYSG